MDYWKFPAFQWLGLSVFPASLVGELRSCKPHSMTKNENNMRIITCLVI